MKRILPLIASVLIIIGSLFGLYSNLNVLLNGLISPLSIISIVTDILVIVIASLSAISSIKDSSAKSARSFNLMFATMEAGVFVYGFANLVALFAALSTYEVTINVSSLSPMFFNLVFQSMVIAVFVVSSIFAGKKDKVRKILSIVGLSTMLGFEIISLISTISLATPTFIYIAVEICFISAMIVGIVANSINSFDKSEAA